MTSHAGGSFEDSGRYRNHHLGSPYVSLSKPVRFGDVSNRLPSSPLTVFTHGYLAKMIYSSSNTHRVA
jgi:hypothetical protein